ncbi:MAG TPA: ferritin [Bacilli bacterium]|jgi:ferritin|nr:ferritin [Bacilli bacterium]HOR20829.1 ferritin [Bacilli bacterium]HPK67559.1 ferritin [Bacilli bacterium]HPM07640.1 ferritin [Bacilli bacterium]HPY38609.1 ferritin [Bacilli bacterium]
MVTKKVVDLLNLQIQRELYSAYLYLDMALYYNDLGLVGHANWFEIQAQEERDHALGFIRYLQHVGERPLLDVIDKPSLTYKDPREPLVEALKHEKFVTASIENILEVAKAEKDHLTVNFIQWYIAEQGEEEKNANDNILMYDFAKGDRAALLVIDGKHHARKYSPSIPDID